MSKLSHIIGHRWFEIIQPPDTTQNPGGPPITPITRIGSRYGPIQPPDTTTNSGPGGGGNGN